MQHQANRQSQPSPAKKPGALMSCLCAQAPNVVSREYHGSKAPIAQPSRPRSPHPAGRPQSQSSREQATGKGNWSKPIPRARITGYVQASRARIEHKRRPALGTGQYLISVCSAARHKCMINKESALLRPQFDILGIVRIIQITLNGIRHLQRGAAVMDPGAVQQVQCNKGRKPAARPMGIRHQDWPGTARHGQSIRGIRLYKSSSYASSPCSAQHAGPAASQANRWTPGGAGQDRIARIGRKNRSLTPMVPYA